MIVKIIEIIYHLLFLITPLIMLPNTSELFEFNKLLVIYIATVLISLLWLSRMILNKKIIFKKTIVDIPILLFLASQIISTVVSIDPHTSLFGYYGRFNGGLLSILSYIILYYAFVSNQIPVRKLLKTMLITSVLVILWAIPGKLGADLTCLIFSGKFDVSCWSTETIVFNPIERVFSTLGQPNWFGAYLAINFFIGIYYWITNKDNKQLSILNIGYLLLNFAFILFSRSRSSLVSVIIGLIVLAGYYYFIYRKQAKSILLTLIAIIVIPIILFKTGINKIDNIIRLPVTIITSSVKQSQMPVVNNQNQPTTNQITTPLNITDSLDIRKIVWLGAINLGLKYPLFGTGVETFAYSYYFVRPIAHNLTSEWDYIYNKAHNEYLNYLATTGFVGLISYLLVIFLTISFVGLKIKDNYIKYHQNLNGSVKLMINSKSKKNDSKNNQTINELNYQLSNQNLFSVCLFGSYLTILITNFFGFSTTTINIFFFLFLAFIINYSIKDNKFNESYDFENLSNLQSFSLFSIVVISVYLLVSIFVYWNADINYAMGLKYANPQYNYHPQAVEFFNKAIKLRSNEHVYQDKIAYSLAYMSALSSYQKQYEDAKSQTNLSKYFSDKAIASSPSNVLYLKSRSKNQFLFYQSDNNPDELIEAVKYLNKAETISPTDPKISYTLALFYASLFDMEKNITSRGQYQQLSIENIDKAIKLKSNFRDAYFFKGQLLKKYGDRESARQVFQYILNTFDPNDVDVKKELSSI